MINKRGEFVALVEIHIVGQNSTNGGSNENHLPDISPFGGLVKMKAPNIIEKLEHHKTPTPRQ